MSTFLERPGGAGKVRISALNQADLTTVLGSPVFYNIQDWSTDDEVETGDTTNTESETNSLGTPCKEEVDVVAQIKWMLKAASYDVNMNFFTLPMVFTVGEVIKLEIFPNGILSTPYLIKKAKIKKRRWEGKAGGLQPITLEGVSLGNWTSQPGG